MTEGPLTPPVAYLCLVRSMHLCTSRTSFLTLIPALLRLDPMFDPLRGDLLMFFRESGLVRNVALSLLFYL